MECYSVTTKITQRHWVYVVPAHSNSSVTVHTCIVKLVYVLYSGPVYDTCTDMLLKQEVLFVHDMAEAGYHYDGMAQWCTVHPCQAW